MNIAQNWRMNGQRYALKGTKCEHCGAVHASPREICPNCEARTPQFYNFSNRVVIELPEAHELRQAAR